MDWHEPKLRQERAAGNSSTIFFPGRLPLFLVRTFLIPEAASAERRHRVEEILERPHKANTREQCLYVGVSKVYNYKCL